MFRKVKLGPVIDLSRLPLSSTGEPYRFARVVTDERGKTWVAVSQNLKHWSPGTPEANGVDWEDPQYDAGAVRPVNWDRSRRPTRKT